MTAEDKAKNAGKVALVLEGGSFRGQFTAGVLDVLMEAGVEIPAVYGVSAGALNGVNYKSHQIGRANRINLAFCNDSRFMGAASFASTGSIVGYDFIFNDVQDRLDPFDNETFYASPIEMYAAVDVFVPVDLDRRRHQRQRRRCAHSVEVKYGAFDRQVRGGSKEHVRRDGVHLDRAGVERLVIKRIQAVLDVVEDKVVTHDGTRGRKRRGAHVAAVVAEGQIDSVGATDLVRLVVDAIERTGRDAVHRRNFDTGLHENVEHAGGKLPTKTATLQDERDLAGVLCLIFCSHIDLLRLRFDFLLPSFGMEGAQVF